MGYRAKGYYIGAFSAGFGGQDWDNSLRPVVIEFCGLVTRIDMASKKIIFMTCADRPDVPCIVYGIRGCCIAWVYMGVCIIETQPHRKPFCGLSSLRIG